MKRKMICRMLIGAPVGISIGVVISVLISLAAGDGKYYSVVPELITDFGSEINAVIVQLICFIIHGAVFAGASVIWDAEKWSFTRMTITHLAVVLTTTVLVAWFMRWMEHSAKGIFTYAVIFFGIYAVIWISQYWTMKKRIKQWNEKISGDSF